MKKFYYLIKKVATVSPKLTYGHYVEFLPFDDVNKIKYYMLKFYEFQKMQPVAANLSWSHYIELLSLKNYDEIYYYINKSIKNNLSKRQLRELIKSKEYKHFFEVI